jgi:adenylate kinase
MKLIFLGPPGAGKGTLAASASSEMGIPHVSTGELFRTAIREGTELGKKVKAIIDSGGLVSDQLTIDLVKERLGQVGAQKGWILDGFPRTVAQAEALEAMSGYDTAVNFDVGNDEVVKRLSGRRVCRKCSRNYHVRFMPPKREGVCDACGGELYTRDDDAEAAIRIRLAAYHAQTEPLIGFFASRGKLVTVDARPAPEVVMNELRKALEKK